MTKMSGSDKQSRKRGNRPLVGIFYTVIFHYISYRQKNAFI